MKKNCIFTIVAKNYIGLAQILELSVGQYHQDDVDFYIITADEIADARSLSLPRNVLIAKQITNYAAEEWLDMSFKYTLTEFCTAIKPAVFQYFFSQSYEKVIYFDPDIYVFSPLSKLFGALDQYDMVLTPHVADIHPQYQGEDEWAINVTGMFNLGFCGIRKAEDMEKLLQWWRFRLISQAFCDRTVGTFTDQKWMDWAPAFLGDRLCVMGDLGTNLAPWNFFEREIYRHPDNTLWVKPRHSDSNTAPSKLVFVHFSGYDYQLLLQHIIAHQRLSNPEQYADIEQATRVYSDALIAHRDTFQAFISQDYSYGRYDNGCKIEQFHRRLYNGLKQQGTISGNPFATDDHSFYHTLKKKSMFTKESVDNLTPKNMSDYNKKISILNRVFHLLYRLMGYHRYPLFVKSLHHYTQPESHTFLVSK